MTLLVLLAAGRSSFPLGCRNRPRLAMVCAAVGAWGLTYCALRVAPLTHGHSPELVHALHRSVTHALRVTEGPPRLGDVWSSMIEILVAGAVAISVLAVRSLLRPAPAGNHHVEHEYRAARAIVEEHGRDSLSPFVLRPDKALLFAAGGLLSYRVIRGTAIVSADPVAPAGREPEVLAAFLELARRRGWQVALWGASDRHLDAYRELGLRAVCTGEEAIVDPAGFTLGGAGGAQAAPVGPPDRPPGLGDHRPRWTLDRRRVRVRDRRPRGRAGAARARGCTASPWAWGPIESELRPDDMYVLARSPEGELGAVMRFAAHCGNLSLDTMRRVGATPNGLNEAMVCRVLELARERDIPQVSLNYAGLAHLVRGEANRRGSVRLGRRPCWSRPSRATSRWSAWSASTRSSRPRGSARYLVYQSPRGAAAHGPARAAGRGLPPGPPAAATAPSPAGAAARGCALAARQGREVATGMRRLPRRRPVVLALTVVLAVIGLVGAYRYWESYYQHRGFATVAYLPHAQRGRRLDGQLLLPGAAPQRRLPGLPAARL